MGLKQEENTDYKLNHSSNDAIMYLAAILPELAGIARDKRLDDLSVQIEMAATIARQHLHKSH